MSPSPSSLILEEEDTQTEHQILFYAISSLIAWIGCSLFAWMVCGHLIRNVHRISSLLVAATFGVFFFCSIHSFIAFIFSTNVFVRDNSHIMMYGCAQSLHFDAFCYGAYRYSLYMFYLIRIREFFRDTAHEFKRQKFVASAVVIALTSFCLMAVSVFYLTPTIISSGPYLICAATLNDELREEILTFLVVDVFVSLYLTWLFVIKSRALLALENANKNAMEQMTDDSDNQEQKEQEEERPLNGVLSPRDHVPTTYFIDAKDGGLRTNSVKRLMMRCIYFGMLAMMVTWVHLALRFIEYIDICCIEMVINSLCVLLSFDLFDDGPRYLLCWCAFAPSRRPGFGRNVRRESEEERNYSSNGLDEAQPAVAGQIAHHSDEAIEVVNP